MTEQAEDREPVANPYRAALVSRREAARPVAAELRDRLASIGTAMEGGAWQSTTATAFETDLTGHTQRLGQAADGTIQEYDDAIERQPLEVDPWDWQTRWHQYARVW